MGDTSVTDASSAAGVDSFLSSAVKDLFVTAISACRASNNRGLAPQVVIRDPDGSIGLDFTKMAKMLRGGLPNIISSDIDEISACFDNQALKHSSFGYFKRFHSIMGPVIQKVFHCAKNTSAAITAPRLIWTGRADVLVEAFDLCCSPLPDKVSVLLALQTTTCAVERALGNVIVSAGAGSIPFLLKDILGHPVLREVFGGVPITLLTALMGPPSSLNLRNLAWHGFLSPEDIVPEWVVFIVIVLSSIRPFADLCSTGSKILQPRSSLQYKSDMYPQHFQLYMNGLDMRSLGEDLLRALQTAPVPMQRKPVWTRIAEEMCSNNSSWTTLQLILPQFETILRIVFARVNKQEFRVVTAEQDEFFTTFDEILAVNVGSEKNGIRSVLGDKYLIFLLDLLIYPKGPRIRHRISHGETDEQHCPIYLIKAVIVAVVGILAKVSCHEQSSSLARIIQHYEPQFHPVDELRRKYQSFLSSLRTLEACPTIAGYSRSLRMEEAFSEAFCAVDNGGGSSWFATLDDTLRDCPFESLYRPAAECPVTKLIHSIIDTAELSVVNIGEFLHIRHSTHVKDGGIPRQSESNYLSLIHLLPPLLQAWMETFLQTLWLYQRTQREPDHSEMARFLTWLQKTLQVWQNVGILSASHRNDWPKVLSWLARLPPPPT